jgi:hypothetical protein
MPKYIGTPSEEFRVTFYRGRSKPDENLHVYAVDAEGAERMAIDYAHLEGWRVWGIRRVERRDWRSAIEYGNPRMMG